MSAPRPYETYPFHPPALFTPCSRINSCIYTKLFQSFLPCGIYIVSWNIAHLSCTHAPFQNHLFQGSAPFLSHFLHYVVRIGTRYSETLPWKLDTDAEEIFAAMKKNGRQKPFWAGIKSTVEELLILGFLIKQLLYSGLLDIKWLQPTRRYAPRWLSITWYPARPRRMIVKYFTKKGSRSEPDSLGIEAGCQINCKPTKDCARGLVWILF